MENRDTRHLRIPNSLQDEKLSQTQSICWTKCVSTLRQQFRRKLSKGALFPPFLKHFRYWKLSITLKVSSTKVFGTRKQNEFDRKVWNSTTNFAPLIRKNIFWQKEIAETQNGSSRKGFGTVRQNNTDWKSW